MGKCGRAVIATAVGLIIPVVSQAQGLANQMSGLHGVLEDLYDEMLPLCGQMIGIGQGIAGFGALWYIAARVYKSIASAEPIDFYPLLRPFAIGLCIMFFPAVIAIINGVMKPTVSGTAAMLTGSNKAIEVLLKQKEEALKKTDKWQMYVGDNEKGDREKWYKYTRGEKKESWLDGIGNDISFAMEKSMYNFRNSVKEWMSEVLRVIFEAAALCVNTLRTFQLIVLAILGPLVFGLSVFDGFQHTLTAWLAKYINIFLWLPVANIFGAVIAKIQENMIKLDIRQIAVANDTFFSSTDIGYLIFLIIGIVGYFTVPSVANSIVNAGGGGGMVQKITSMAGGMASSIPGAPLSAVTSAIDTKKSFDDGQKYDAGTGISGALGRMTSKNKDGSGDYQHSKLSGRD